MKLRAPYNFIPLSDSVFHPDWAGLISFEKPFEDGMSGIIDVTLTAMSPIFVRNGLSKLKVTDSDRRDAGKNDYNRFNHIVDADGKVRYFIPGSSVKGMLRSTVEIISNGKFSQVENQSFGKRDLGDRSYKNAMSNVLCGWMYVEDGEWKIEDHGKPWKVSVELLEGLIPDLMEHIKDRKKLLKDENKIASAKYRMRRKIEGQLSEMDFDDLFKGLKVTFSIKTIKTSRGKSDVVETVNGKGDNLSGTVVFTGQQGAYQEGKFNPGKHHEFIFPADPQEKYTVRPVSEDVVQAFRTIHANSDDWTELWADQLLNRGQRIPVFFCNDEDGNVTSIGLASMYKFPYKNSVWDVIPESHKSNEPDLAECMFGYSREDNGKLTALKGRVHVGHFFVDEASSSPKESEVPHKLILGTPHPSYYPLYVQEGKTWDEAVMVNGRKFYPIRQDNAVETRPNDEMVVKGDGELAGSAIAICPLAANTAFSGKIRFFNLKPFELGALVSALTLNYTLFDDKDKKQRYHSIGMGKPLGYGKTSVTVNGIRVIENKPEQQEWIDKTVEDCISLFKQGVSGYNFDDWKKPETGVCAEFAAMTSENGSVDSYMLMSTNRKLDEFRTIKEERTGEGLQRFTVIQQTEKPPLSEGEYPARITSVRKTYFEGKDVWNYAVTIDGYPGVILKTGRVQLRCEVRERVFASVVRGKNGDLWVNRINKVK